MSGYIGSQPADSFLSISSQQISGNGGATYSLSSSVTSPEDVAVFVNNVRQNPNTYSVSNNQITLGGTIASSDSCYVVFLGKTLATVNPPSGSVGNNQVSASLINSQTAESSANDSDEILIYDNSATALKKQTRANFLTGVGGANTPAFSVYLGSSQTISDATDTKINFDTEDYDTASAYSTTNKRFTCPSGQAGKYFFYARIRFSQSDHNDQYVLNFRKNGSEVAKKLLYGGAGTKIFNSAYFLGFDLSCTETLAVGDYIEAWAKADNVGGNNITIKNDSTQSEFLGFKLIGV